MKISFHWVAAIVLLLLMLDSGYFIDRKDFTHLILVYLASFSLYFFILKSVKSYSDIDFWLKMGVILRGVLLFSLPHFSEDIYRFIWDGRLINLGINPFSFKPSYFIENQLYQDVLTTELYAKLNSPNYHTVYPSVCQAIFAFAVWLFPKSIYGTAIIIKTFLLAAEIGNIFLLKKLMYRQSVIQIKASTQFNYSKRILIYVLNPLIIIELCGNAHFEAAMIFFFLLSIYVLKQSNISVLKSGIFYALSIASKMLPLMFLPFLIKRLGIKKSVLFFMSVGICTFFLFLPLLNSVFIQNIQSSLQLYFQKFEFNASVYYVLRAIGEFLYGFNTILWLSYLLTGAILIGFLILFLKNWLKKEVDTEGVGKIDFEVILWAISLYFLFATTVHPWYAALPLVISVFTRFNYVAVWTSLLPLSYIHYTYMPFQENYILIALEYGVTIGFFVYERRIKQIRQQN